MKILAIADQENQRIWSSYKPKELREPDLILSAGDLDPDYLQFCVTYARSPVFYIHGNHDERYQQRPPEGCVCVEDDIVVYQGIRILGLGGCMRYRPGAYQYTERQMRRRIRHLWLKLRSYGGFDILLTHAPAAGYHDSDDPNDRCHHGFAVFNELIEKYEPRFHIHGHIHMNYNIPAPVISQRQQTTVINASGGTVHFVYEQERAAEAASGIIQPVSGLPAFSQTEPEQSTVHIETI